MDGPLVANPGRAGSSALCCDGRANYQGELFLRKRVITETITDQLKTAARLKIVSHLWREHLQCVDE